MYGLAILLIAIVSTTAAGTEAQPPRGLVLITIDTLRADHVGGYGNLGLTPNIDRLAARGTLIEHAVTPTPTTGPAHASMFTGQHPWRHGVLDNAVPFDTPRGDALAEILKSSEFRTAAFVSSYVLDSRFRFDRGFETYWFDPKHSYTWMGEYVEAFWSRGEHTTNAAMRWLGERASDSSRFFAFVHLFDPHSPYSPPPELLYQSETPVELAHKRLPPQTGSWAELSELIRKYRGEVRYVDKQVGRLLDRIRILGLEDEVAVIVTSDHGEGLGDHGHLEHGRNLFGELLRVPLIVAGPGIPKAARLAGPVQLEDLHPTILTLLGISREDSSKTDGLDLTSWLTGAETEPPRTKTYGRRKYYPDQPDWYFQGDVETKWIGTLDNNGVTYDLKNDPRELAGEGGRRVPGDLLERVERDRHPDPARRQLDEESRRALEALGYIE